MNSKDVKEILEIDDIQQRIFTVRGMQVILDRDLSNLYGVDLSQMNRQVKRNIERFPEDFMFQLTQKEWIGLKCHFGISNPKGGDRGLPHVLRYVFLELGRFRKRLWELETKFDKWMYLLCHMHEMVEIPQIFQEPEFKRLFILSEINNFTADEYKEYLKSISRMSDYYNIIDSAEKLAREEGREEGIKQVARKLLAFGMETSMVAEMTGLSLEIINSLD